MLTSSMMFEASEMQVSILQSPFKLFCHGMQINMPTINKSIMILRASAASWHLFWSHNLWMPGRSIHSRCPMTLYFWMCLIGYGTSLDLKTYLSRGKHNILFLTLIPFWARHRHTLPLTPLPLKHLKLSQLPTPLLLLCPECRLMDWVSFNSFSLRCRECRLLQGCRLIFGGYLPWVSFITWVSSIRESRVAAPTNRGSFRSY